MAPGPATAIRHIRSFLADADPQRVSTARAAELVETFVELEQLSVAGKLLFAARAAEGRTWVDKGHVSAAFWLAELAKVPVGDAVSTLQTSKRLENLPDTAEAVRAGDLSGAQASEVTRAATKDPAAEQELLELSASGSFKGLRDRSLQVMAQAASRQDEAERHRELHAKRSVRHYTDYEGAFRLDARLTPEAGARLMSSIQTEADRIFKKARSEGVEEPPEAYRADALVALATGRGVTERGCPDVRSSSPAATGTSRSRSPADTIFIRVDASALKRGYVQGGELCEIPGVGPVSVSRVRQLLPFCDVNVVFRNAVDVQSVSHLGRTVTAPMRVALDERDPTCRVPECAVAQGLEYHHYLEDFAECGTTSVKGLVRVCARHHDMISYSGWVLEGGPGKWRFRGPPDSSDQERLAGTG
ncbi:MAG TPA: DUF222 domain-containing protein [Acidimicrobiales bacterium]|nr:DUF222 domain-containing protein [Acidimicrobiales bacterium]